MITLGLSDREIARCGPRPHRPPQELNNGPFAIHISDADLADLKSRLAHTRWTDDFANEDWRYGANAHEIRELVNYWRA